MLRFRGSGFRDWGLGCRILGFRVDEGLGSGFGVWESLGERAQGSEVSRIINSKPRGPGM